MSHRSYLDMVKFWWFHVHLIPVHEWVDFEVVVEHGNMFKTLNPSFWYFWSTSVLCTWSFLQTSWKIQCVSVKLKVGKEQLMVYASMWRNSSSLCSLTNYFSSTAAKLENWPRKRKEPLLVHCRKVWWSSYLYLKLETC